MMLQPPTLIVRVATSTTAAGEVPGEVAPHQGSVNTQMICDGRDGPARGVRDLRNEGNRRSRALSTRLPTGR
jgi:hypothetical protein